MPSCRKEEQAETMGFLAVDDERQPRSSGLASSAYCRRQRFDVRLVQFAKDSEWDLGSTPLRFSFSTKVVLLRWRS